MNTTYDRFEPDPTPITRKRSGPFGSETLKTVAEAVAFCERMGLDPAEVSLANNYVIWSAEETPEEISQRVQAAKRSQRRHLDAVRAMYDEYAARGLFDSEVPR